MTQNKSKSFLMLVLVMFCASFLQAQTYTKGKGRTYSTVIMGKQVWMAKNLDVDKFRNGDRIPQAKTNEDWKKAGENQEPAWCYYDNDREYGKKYGKLYNWYAVSDPRGLAPKGWHVPTDEEWLKLTDYLGGDKVAGTKMKSTSGWKSYDGVAECANCKNWIAEQKAGQTCSVCNDSRKTKAQVSGNGSNVSGFTGLPGGNRFHDGTFVTIGGLGVWWSSTELNTGSAWNRGLVYSFGYAYRYYYAKTDGFSVRCLRD